MRGTCRRVLERHREPNRRVEGANAGAGKGNDADAAVQVLLRDLPLRGLQRVVPGRDADEPARDDHRGRGTAGLRLLQTLPAGHRRRSAREPFRVVVHCVTAGGDCVMSHRCDTNETDEPEADSKVVWSDLGGTVDGLLLQQPRMPDEYRPQRGLHGAVQRLRSFFPPDGPVEHPLLPVV